MFRSSKAITCIIDSIDENIYQRCRRAELHLLLTLKLTLKINTKMETLKDIKEFNTLQRNLELTKALQDVDKLRAEIVKLQLANEKLSLRSKMNSIRKKELSDEITKLKAERLKSNL